MGRKTKIMSTARVLSSNELGRELYSRALEAQQWPVEVRYRDSSVSFGRPAEVLLSASIASGSPRTAVFQRASRAEWIAFTNATVGIFTYRITVNGRTVAAGGIDVYPPQLPLALSDSVKNLRTSAPSGASQLDSPSVDGKWRVCFKYVEEVFTVRDVFVECKELGDSFRLTRKMKGEAEEFEIHEDAYVGVVELPIGSYSYRFRVVLREHMRPDAAPFTNLGWDPSVSHSGGLATWRQEVKVQDLAAMNAREAGPAAIGSEPPAEPERSPVSVEHTQVAPQRVGQSKKPQRPEKGTAHALETGAAKTGRVGGPSTPASKKVDPPPDPNPVASAEVQSRPRTRTRGFGFVLRVVGAACVVAVAVAMGIGSGCCEQPECRGDGQEGASVSVHEAGESFSGKNATKSAGLYREHAIKQGY